MIRFFVFCFYFFFIQPVLAATEVPLRHLELFNLKQQFQMSQQKLHAATSFNQLHFLKQHQDPHHVYHIRFQQSYRNTPVYGAELIMHSPLAYPQTLQSQTRVYFTGQIFNHLEQDLGPYPFNSLRKQAVLQKFKQKYQTTHFSQEKMTPIIYLDKDKQAHWAYQIHVFFMDAVGHPVARGAIVDVTHLKLYEEWNDLKTQAIWVKGKGYGGNPLMGELKYGETLSHLLMQYMPDTQQCAMQNKQALVVDMKHSETNRLTEPMSFPCAPSQETDPVYLTGYSQDGYDKSNEANSPSNDALFAAQIIKNLYNDWYHLEPLVKKSGDPMKLIMRVHFGKNFVNAYWDGKQMTFGDGDKNTAYPLVSVGISAHEISHGFTEQHSNLHYNGQSGALNESFSDMADKAAEFYAGFPLDWRIGWEILKPQSPIKAFRHMDFPSKDGYSVETLQAYLIADKISYNKYGEGLDVHFGSGVFNRVFYLLSTKPNWSIHKAFDVAVYANLNYWTSHVNFQNAGCGMLYAARDLKYATEDVADALLKVGLKPQECTEISV